MVCLRPQQQNDFATSEITFPKLLGHSQPMSDCKPLLLLYLNILSVDVDMVQYHMFDHSLLHPEGTLLKVDPHPICLLCDFARITVWVYRTDTSVLAVVRYIIGTIWWILTLHNGSQSASVAYERVGHLLLTWTAYHRNQLGTTVTSSI